MKRNLAGILILFLLAACTPEQTPTATEVSGYLVNPASAYCEAQGYTLEIRDAPDGSQSGVCVFPDGTECEEWAYFRGECGPVLKTASAEPPADSAGWAAYQDDELGYSFEYPAEAELSTADNPLGGLTISGQGMNGETWVISHPADREEYRPPEGVDLEQWLSDHFLEGEMRMPDEQIAGTTAIHYRHERSPQSFADDRYYFARAGQLYQVLIGHSDAPEDWELNNRFLHSIQFE